MRQPKQICKNGHDTFITGRDKTGHCIICKHKWQKSYCDDNKEKVKLARQKWDKAHKDHIKERMHQWYIDNRDERIRKRRKYIKEHMPELVISTRKWRQEHREKAREIARVYKQLHPWLSKLYKLRTHIKRSLRIPKFGQRGIITFYRNCPRNLEIDHIIPLLGKKVSGLHVKWNLQYLDRPTNSSKGNRIDLMEASIWYGKLLEKEGLK